MIFLIVIFLFERSFYLCCFRRRRLALSVSSAAGPIHNPFQNSLWVTTRQRRLSTGHALVVVPLLRCPFIRLGEGHFQKEVEQRIEKGSRDFEMGINSTSKVISHLLETVCTNRRSKYPAHTMQFMALFERNGTQWPKPNRQTLNGLNAGSNDSLGEELDRVTGVAHNSKY